MSENDLQEQIMRFLKGIVEPTGRGTFWRQSNLKGRFLSFTEFSAVLKSVANGHGESALRRARAVQTGREGLPDIGGVFDGKPWMCEVKLPNGTLSDVQERMIAHLRSQGVTVVVARSVRDVEDATVPRKVQEDSYDYAAIPF